MKLHDKVLRGGPAAGTAGKATNPVSGKYSFNVCVFLWALIYLIAREGPFGPPTCACPLLSLPIKRIVATHSLDARRKRITS